MRNSSSALLAAAHRRNSVTFPFPVAWWKFNEGSGTTAADSSGNNHLGTFVGGMSWTTGPNSTNAVSTDGTGHVTISNSSDLGFERTDKFSLTGWIKANSSLTGGGHSFFTKETSIGNGEGYDFSLDADNFRLQTFLIGSNGSFILARGASSSFPLNAWKFVVFTYDGSSTGAGAKIYVDGALYAVGFGSLTASIQNSNALNLGLGTTFHFWGDMDDFRVYNVELSLDQVNTLFTAGAQ